MRCLGIYAEVFHLPGVLSCEREEIYSLIRKKVKEYFGEDVILTGIDDCCVELALNSKRFTFGFCLDEIDGVFDNPLEAKEHLANRDRCLQKVLDYVNNTIVIYNGKILELLGNMEYKILLELEMPKYAIVGFLRLSFNVVFFT